MKTEIITHRIVRVLGIAAAICFSICLTNTSHAVIVEFREGETTAVNPGATIVSGDVKDNDIRSGTPNTATGGNPRWNVGFDGTNKYRTVVEFNVTSLPTAVMYTSVTLNAYRRDSILGFDNGDASSHQIDLYRNPQGFANENTVTWNTFTPAGGDLSGGVLASITPNASVEGAGFKYTFASSASFLSALTSAVNSDGILRLELKATNEITSHYYSFSASDDGGGLEGVRPLLTVNYTVPEPASLGLLGVAAIGLLARRRAK